MATIDEVGQQDDWRCWLCDEVVDPQLSVNDGRGPSVDPVAIIPAAERLLAKGGRQIMGRCLSVEDAEAAMVWIVDRLNRLEPDLEVTSEVHDGGGQFLVVLNGLGSRTR